MSITAVSGQGGGTNANATTSVSRAFPSNVTAGNLITVCAMKSTTASDAWLAADCTKSAGTATIDTPVLDKTIEIQVAGGFFQAVAIWSCLVLTSGSCTMQAGGAAAGTDLLIATNEWNGSNGWAATRVESSASSSTATDNLNGTTGNATSAGGALFLAAIAIDLSSSIAITEDAAFTLIFEDENGTTDEGGSAIFRIVVSGTTDAGDWTIGNNGGWGAALVVYKELAGGVGGSSPLFSNPGRSPFMAARFPAFTQGIAPTTVTAQIGQPWLMWATQERVDAEDDIYRGPNHQLLHRYRFNFQTVGQPQFLTRFRTSTPEVPEPYDVLSARPLLHLYRQAFQTVGQSYRLWPRGRITLEPEDQQTAKPSDLTPFRATTPVATGRQPWFIWLTPKIDWEIEVLATKANHDLLHRYRFNFQTVGQPWLTWPGPAARLEPEDDPRRVDQHGLHRFRTGFQTVGQSWQYWIKPQARIDDEPNAPTKAADLSPFRTTAPTVQPGQPWFMFQAAEPDLTIEPDAVRTDHAAALYPFRPHSETPPPEPSIVIVSPEPGSVPGWVPDSQGRLHGPYKRPGQVFGETFPLSPNLGAPPATGIGLLEGAMVTMVADGIDALVPAESQEFRDARALDHALAAFALWAMMESDDR